MKALILSIGKPRMSTCGSPDSYKHSLTQTAILKGWTSNPLIRKLMTVLRDGGNGASRPWIKTSGNDPK